MIKIRNLQKVYKGYNNFTIDCGELDINKGEIIGVYGSVASGKTVFSKLIAGFHKKYDGQIEVGMMDLRNVPAKMMSYIPSTNILYNDLTLNDHVRFLGSEFKLSKTEISAKINWFDQFYLVSAKLGRKIHTFSTGELQYIKMFLSLLHSPSVVIIDELFTGLGSDDINLIKKIFKELSEREVTILFTSSHLEYIKELTDKKYYIKNGLIET